MRDAASYSRSMTEIVGQLVRASGVDPRWLDANRLDWVIEARCRNLKLDGAAVYAEHLKSSPEELDALIDATVVQETRFFRDSTVFRHLELWLPRMASDFLGPLRILSAPCSTGQEAYSLAATLQQAGIPLARFTIDAFDISIGALHTARRGVYPEDAMRNLAADRQQVCGVLGDKQWAMHEALRRRIRFERRNLAEPGALDAQPDSTDRAQVGWAEMGASGAGGPYHLILCRNLFIYLRPQARAVLARSLASALVPGGRLVIGTADRVEELNSVFLPQKPAASFAFTHRHPAAPAGPGADASLKLGSNARQQEPIARKPKPSLEPVLAQAAPAPAAPESTVARHAAPSAESFYQSALQHHLHGDPHKAERRCRQALYLDPKYLPALELLATLWIQNPNQRLRRALEVRILRNRLAAEIPSSSSSSPTNWGDEPGASWKETA
jgi:chemotaxis protein methyltransferase WspC